MTNKHKAILVGLGMVVIAALVLVPKVRDARMQANRSAQLTNFLAIEHACYLYGQTNDGQYPPTLEVLVEQGLLSGKSLLNPNRPWQKIGYVYIRPANPDVLGLTVYEAFDEWNEGVMTNLGFITNQDLFKKVLAETQQGDGLSTETMEALSKVPHSSVAWEDLANE